MRRWRDVLLGCVLVLSLAASLSAQSRPAPKSVQISPDPLEIKPGDPLSARALVPKPTPLKGLLSWSLETRRHRSYMSVIAPSPDGKEAATGGIDGTIRIWNLETGKCVRALIGHNSYVYGVAWSPDGNTIASGGAYDGTVRLWDVRTGRPLKVLRGMKEFATLCDWSPDGKQLAVVGGTSGYVWLWRSIGGDLKEITSFGHYITSVEWSPDGEQLAIAAQQQPATILNMSSGKLSRYFGKPEDGMVVARWSPDGKTLATGSATTIGLWDPSVESEAVEVPPKKLEGPAAALAWSPDGSRLVAAAPSELQIWDVKDAKVVKKLPTVANRLNWLGAGTQILCQTSVAISTWDTATDKAVQQIDAAGLTPPLWTPNRPIILGIGTPSVSLWDANTAKALKTLTGHTAAINAAAWSKDGKLLATASSDRTARIWEVSSGKLLKTLEDHKGVVTCVSFAADGKTLATGGSEPIVRLWSVTTGELQASLPGHTAQLMFVAWSPTGGLLASGGYDKSIKIWNTQKKEIIRSIPTKEIVYSVSWAGDSKTLACGTGDDDVVILQPSLGKQLGSLVQAGSPKQVTGIAWSADGNAVFVGRGNHTAQLWDLKTSKVIHNLPTMAPVQYVAWANPGNVIAAGNQERTVRFWDAPTGQVRGLIIGEPDHVILVGSDGNYRIDPDHEPDLVMVALTPDAQTTYTLTDFAVKMKWKNQPTATKVGK